MFNNFNRVTMITMTTMLTEKNGGNALAEDAGIYALS